MGAESFKIEWKDNPDTRLAVMVPVGGRDAATGARDPDMGGQFNNKSAGKRGISLNIRHPKGLQIAKDMVRICDVVAEGFSPGVLQHLGLGYDVMKSIGPDIIYIQQSSMGAHGRYGRMRTVGPVAAAFARTAGLPLPALPTTNDAHWRKSPDIANGSTIGVSSHWITGSSIRIHWMQQSRPGPERKTAGIA
jgi:hypothetical protein